MDSTAFSTELAQNRATYDRLKHQIRSAMSRQYAAIAHGKLIAVTDTFDDGVAAVRRLRPVPEHFLVFPVDEEPVFDVIDDFFVGPRAVVQLAWQAVADGRYWIDVEIGGEPVRVMIDLGLVDPRDSVGFEVEPSIYNKLNQRGQLSKYQYRFRWDANAQSAGSESGQVAAQLINPQTGQAIGSGVHRAFEIW